MLVEIPEHLEGAGGYNTEKNGWDDATLRDAAKGLEEFKLPLIGIDINNMPWRLSNIGSFLYHAKRVEECSLDYPIILGPLGEIIDGWHRIAKAILSGKETIKAVRLVQMPQPDETF